jgi:hypothetical protein
MFGRISRIGLVVCLLILSLASGVKAQQSVPPVKRELIKEIIVLLDLYKTTDALIDSMLLQSEKDLSAVLSQTVSKEANSTTGEQAALESQLNESAARMHKRFKQLFRERVNFAQILDEIMYALYDKYFTENELRDIVAFYKTPTGRKTIEVLPQLFAESMQRTSAALLPTIQQITNEIIDEEMQQLKNLKPPARTKKRRRR